MRNGFVRNRFCLACGKDLLSLRKGSCCGTPEIPAGADEGPVWRPMSSAPKNPAGTFGHRGDLDVDLWSKRQGRFANCFWWEEKGAWFSRSGGMAYNVGTDEDHEFWSRPITPYTQRLLTTPLSPNPDVSAAAASLLARLMNRTLPDRVDELFWSGNLEAGFVQLSLMGDAAGIDMVAALRAGLIMEDLTDVASAEWALHEMISLKS